MCRIEGFECILPCQVIPRQEFLYSALLVAVSYGVESGGETGERIDTVELTRLDEGGDDRPVLRSSIVSGEESILTIKRYRPDGSLDGVVIDLDGPSVRKTQRPSQYLAT
ncbi:hypothetical protein BAE36_27670 [Rhizobium leguminosarum bv. trifolii]|nr:hypothetical protein BAE36_27670 [Rhizobium leguminosarum bv. trifolii]